MTTLKVLWRCGKWISNLHFTYFPRRNINFYDKKSDQIVKAYVRSENDFLHNILESKRSDGKPSLLPNPIKIVSEQNKLVINQSSNEECCQFHKISQEITQGGFESDKYKPVVKNIAKSLGHLDDLEIERILFDLCLLVPDHFNTPKFKYLSSCLDTECSSRFLQWPMTQQFLVADYFYHMYFSRKSLYNSKFINHLGKKLNVLSDRDVVQMLFFIMVERCASVALMSSIEDRIDSSILNFSVDELGVVCIAFFKTKTPMKNTQLVSKLYKVLKRNIATTDEYIVTAFMKQLRYSSTVVHTVAMTELLTACLPFLNRWSISCLIRVCNLGAHTKIYKYDILARIVDKILLNADSVRLKELTHVFMVVCQSGLKLPSQELLINTVIRQVKGRKSEVDDFPSCLIFALIGLSYLNIYPDDLLNQMFTTINLSMLKLDQVLYEVANIDYSIEIECPWYEGKRLDREQRKAMLQPLCKIPNCKSLELTNSEICRLEILEILQKVPYACKMVHIVPHYSLADVVFCTNLSGKFTDFPETWRPSESDIWYPTNESQFTVIFLGGCSTPSIVKPTLIGHEKRKVRQLNALGYRVIVVFYSEFSDLSATQKEALIKKKINFQGTTSR